MSELKAASKEDYLHVIKHTNLISVDLIIFDEDKNVLVGKRKNNPAINKFFVPGARVYKSEKIVDSIPRICQFELGIILKNPKFRGVYEHIYDNNFDNNNFGTHYVNFAYEFHVDNDTKKKISNSTFSKQHSEITWMKVNNLLNNDEVAFYCKNHFLDKPVNNIV